jgi:5'-3' exonuclease
MKLHLVDGTYELFRAFYGPPGATSPSGMEVGAVRALLRTLLALVQEEGATHVGVAFDHVIESFRNDLFSGYKTGAGIDPLLWAQFPLAEQATQALGLTVWPMVEFEADDALATAAFRWKGRVDQVVLCTPDKDMAQLVTGSKVVLWDRKNDVILDEAGVIEKFGVEPASIPDWLALVGDAVDGIPGLPKWGKKSAAALLARYRHVGHIPDEARAWDVPVRGATGLAETLRDRRDELGLYVRLATLRHDVPLTEELADLEWRGARRTELEALCARIGAPRLLERVRRWRE